MLEDKILIFRLRGGSNDAFRLIYEKYRDYLLRIAASLLSDKGIAEDVVHDVFTNFIDTSKNFRLTGSLKGYLAVCVANKARNQNRKNYRQKTVSLNFIDSAVSNIIGPDQWVIYNEQSQQIYNAMQKIPYHQREVVVLHLQGAMKFREIANLQKTSTKTVVSRYRYGLDKLQSILDCEELK